MSEILRAAAVKFKWQKDDKTYDYLIPAELKLAAGDKVIVETKRGETEVEIVAIKDQSDKAEKPILRRAEPKAPAAAASDEWNF